MKTIIRKISNENPRLTIKVNPENPTVKFSVPSSGYNSPKDGIFNSALIEITIKRKNKIDEMKYQSISNDPSLNTKVSKDLFPQILNDPSVNEIVVELKNSTFTNFYAELTIQKGNDFLDVKNPLQEFREHFQYEGNSKILFSAPFGSGKTTFLDYCFFGENKISTGYEVFKVFPVNYSVASNEDIFRYIKTDILFQLLGKGVKFDEEEESILTTFQEYMYLNPKKTILSFLKNISKLNSKTEILSKVVDSLNEFMKPIYEYHEKQQTDDKEQLEPYIREIYEKEGSLFEDNFYTQVIRQLLEQLRTRHYKESVLVIEDLDRMDPEHIFRILNVISAHYDTYHYAEDQEHHNKFGFDKIILVCDVNNIRNIFHHKYGEKTDFAGYMNKYFSSSPFFYNSLEMKYFYIEKEFTYKGVQNPKYAEIEDCNKFILNKLALVELISFRDLLKLDYQKLRAYYNYHNKSELFYSTITAPIIMFLYEYFGKLDLIKKLKICKENQVKKEASHQLYQYLTTNFIAGISNNYQQEIYYTLNGTHCIFTIEYADGHSHFYNAKPKSPNIGAISTLDDFYDLFIKNVEIYEKLKMKKV